jgi:UDP-GlcNAc:undecaprenyl-phosphate/decaprenyl-phosphate GlcNAc-1-phosphate transferase
MENLLYLIFVLFLINFLFLKNLAFFEKKYNLFDKPDEIRKKQLNPVALLGGLLFIINLSIFLFFDYFLSSKIFFHSLGFIGEINIVIFCLTLLFVFFIGFVDDKIKIKPFTKLILLSIALYVIFLINPKIVINSLNFSFYDKPIDLFGLGVLFSILCVLTYINALNMLDGINLISGIYYLSIITIFLLYNFQISFGIMFLIFSIFFIFLNLKGKIYLGDSGVYVISFLLSLLIIRLYEKNNLNVENVFLLMFLPAVDFFRLIVIRILNRSHPFKADENHFHHLLTKNYNNKKIPILLFFIFLPPLFDFFLGINVYIIILFMILTYYLTLKKIQFKNKSALK